MTITERYWAVLCKHRTPSTSMAHDETWVGPFATYDEAQQSVTFNLSVDARYASAHVCKRLERV